ncbi:MAG: SDR family oxidoreductase, partial [Acidobacteria bacterium]|nr:SDR family oxidoreductase [Acidobacteriota bacterium]
MSRLAGKSVIVTGGANGIGRYYCEHLVREGASVLIADVDIDNGNQLADTLNHQAGDKRAAVVRVDVTSEGDTKDMVKAAIEAFGKIDVLINNAGTYPHKNFEEITYEDWRGVVTINLDSVFLCSRAVLPQMKQQSFGKIINVTTNLVWIGLPAMVHYVAAKSGIVGFTRSLAREIGEHNITVNAIAPGAVAPSVEHLNAASLERLEAIVNHQALKWCQRPSDLVGAILFLASSDSDFISG